MSQVRTEVIDCPMCQAKGEFQIWNSINVDLDPSLREKLFTEELFIWECPQCHTKVYVPFGFIYHDMTRKFMLFYSPEECEDKYEPLEMPDFLQQDEYTYRAVYGIVALKEKIRILESGLNDIAIERLKYVLTHFKVKEFIENQTEILFAECDTNDRELSEYGHISFFFKNQDDELMVGKYRMELYYESDLAVSIDARMSPGQNPCIDQEWMELQFKKSKYV